MICIVAFVTTVMPNFRLHIVLVVLHQSVIRTFVTKKIYVLEVRIFIVTDVARNDLELATNGYTGLCPSTFLHSLDYLTFRGWYCKARET
jgi:hypothetical protein